MNDHNEPCVAVENDNHHRDQPGPVTIQYSSESTKRMLVAHSVADRNGHRQEMWYTWRLSGGNFGMFGEKTHLYGDGEVTHKLSQKVFKVDKTTLAVPLTNGSRPWKEIARELWIERFGQPTRFGDPGYETLSDTDAWVWFHELDKDFPDELLHQVATVQQRKEGLPVPVPHELLVTIRSWVRACTFENKVEFMWFHEEYMNWIAAIRPDTVVVD